VSAEENKALVRRFFQAQVRGDLHAMREMMSPDFVDHSVLPGQEPGREGYIQSVAEDRASFSDVRRIVEDQVATDDTVISRLTISGIHDRGEFAGMVPTGTEMIFTAIVIHRICGGKIADEWAESGGLQELTQRRLEQEIRERERIEQELRVARSIQQASLPKTVPTLEGWQIAHHYQPAREVGGDFYDFHPLSDGRLGVVVGDATGKGVPAALMMSTTCGMLRAVAQSSDYSPGEVLERVNEALFPNIPPNMFVTCFYGILDPQSGRLSYANAGHNLPCCRHENQATELRARGMPLGLMPGMSYEEKETTLELGDSVLFYSDGLIEAHNHQGEMFGTPRLRSFLAEPARGAKDLTAILLKELGRFTGEGWEQEDDITLLALRWSATPS
jgi:serine phosphatase RsbU (regulator of sigma subunit)/predicted ester cyclase